jgi:hypothetical protein
MEVPYMLFSITKYYNFSSRLSPLCPTIKWKAAQKDIAFRMIVKSQSAAG